MAVGEEDESALANQAVSGAIRDKYKAKEGTGEASSSPAIAFDRLISDKFAPYVPLQDHTAPHSTTQFYTAQHSTMTELHITVTASYSTATTSHSAVTASHITVALAQHHLSRYLSGVIEMERGNLKDLVDRLRREEKWYP
jgi:hypothetical protein